MLCIVNWVHGRVCSLLWVYMWVCYRCRYGVAVCHVLGLWIHVYILRLDTCIWLTMRDRDIGEGNGWCWYEYDAQSGTWVDVEGEGEGHWRR